jgi:hypothetical protein
MTMKLSLLILVVMIASSVGLSVASAQQESTSELTLKIDPTDKFKIDRSTEPFRSVRDNAPFAWAIKGTINSADTRLDMRLEESAYDLLLFHASRFSQPELEEYARRDVSFTDLIGNNRLSFQYDVVYLEGRMRRLRKADVTQYLKDHGVANVYEAWIFPGQEQTPFCVFLTELPPGVEAQSDLNKPMNLTVAIAAYSFKLCIYEQQKIDKSSPGGKHALWAAPALIGKSFRVLSAPIESDGGISWRMTFGPVVIAGFTALAICLVALAWYYRRGDRAILDAAAEIRNKNPFEND